MISSALLAGLLLGVSIAAPVGPMALLCIERSLDAGLAAGLGIGLGIASADAAYGSLAAFGFSSLTGILMAHALTLRLVGSAFLIWLGWRGWRSSGGAAAARAVPKGLSPARGYAAAVGLTLTNPATILSFIAAFGAIGLAGRSGGAGWMVAGVFAGSALWWLALCLIVVRLRHALPPSVRLWIGRASSVMLVAFGGFSAWGMLA
jgi:threonine/homoserine/homoserine lactone efflux protein